MSLHKLINLCQCRAGRLIRTNATSTASDAYHQTPHEPCVLSLPSGLKPLLSTKPLVSGPDLSPQNLLPRTQFPSSFPTAFPHFYQPVQAHLEDLSLLCRWVSGPSFDLERVDSLASCWWEEERKAAHLCALQDTSQRTEAATAPCSPFVLCL